MPKRRRERSKTPEVPWETLLVENPVGPVAPSAQEPTATRRRGSRESMDASSSGRKMEQSFAGSNAESVAQGPTLAGLGATPGGGATSSKASEQAAKEKEERDTWRTLVVHLAALRGDPKIEAYLAQRHQELQHVAKSCGALGRPEISLENARKGASAWFERGLKGSNQHGAAARAALMRKLVDTLKARQASLIEACADPPRSAQDALEQGNPEEEGPLLCALLGRELLGSRYEGLWISHIDNRTYLLGDEHPGANLPETDADGARIHPCVRVVVNVRDRRLLIDSFYHSGEDPTEDALNPAKCPIGPFLTVYFEGMSLKDALSRWKGGAPRHQPSGRPMISMSLGGSGAVHRARSPPGENGREQDDIRKLSKGLPAGWEVRTSRSKKGVYYYANPSKGLSQMERPRG